MMMMMMIMMMIMIAIDQVIRTMMYYGDGKGKEFDPRNLQLHAAARQLPKGDIGATTGHGSEDLGGCQAMRSTLSCYIKLEIKHYTWIFARVIRRLAMINIARSVNGGLSMDSALPLES